MAKQKKKWAQPVQKALTDLGRVRSELRSVFCERDDEIEGILTALVARQHALLLGPPGTAKSAMTRAACGAIEGAEYFKWLLTKFSTPEELFGPLSLAGLEKDEYRRVTTGKMPEATVAFLDECFKANSAILNSLLTLLEEREFDNGGSAPTACPLAACFGASNELPKDDSLGALYDRFILRYWVSPLTDHDAMKAVYTTAGTPTVTSKVSGKALAVLQGAADQVTVPNEVAEMILVIKRALEAIGISASDRRWKSCVQVARARALLRGETEVTGSDLMILGHCLWREPDQRKEVMERVGEISSPIAAAALQISDAAAEAHRDLIAIEGTAEFLNRAVIVRADMKEMRQQLQALIDESPGAAAEAEEAMETVRKLQADAKRRHNRALD